MAFGSLLALGSVSVLDVSDSEARTGVGLEVVLLYHRV